MSAFKPSGIYFLIDFNCDFKMHYCKHDYLQTEAKVKIIFCSDQQPVFNRADKRYVVLNLNISIETWIS